MMHSPITGALVPVDFAQIKEEVPELNEFSLNIDTVAFDPLFDSSDVMVSDWVKIARTIEQGYQKYDGFVVLHGTDTMSYTASALSFMLTGLNKPVVFTGSQLPIGVMRTDGKENLISAIEIAADGVVNEVTIFFQNYLLRANRTTKYNAEYFNAFRSENLEPLAKAGISIHYNHSLLLPPPVAGTPLCVEPDFCTDVASLRLFPGISQEQVRAVFGIDGLRGLVLETYGAGNAPTKGWFVDELQGVIARGVVVLNVSQCASGSVDMSVYETGRCLQELGVLSGKDMTFECAITKLMHTLGKEQKTDTLGVNIAVCGEIS